MYAIPGTHRGDVSSAHGPAGSVTIGSQIALTHEQIAALTGTSCETATKILDGYADRGPVRLGPGKLTIHCGWSARSCRV